jgi:hypothetical protein
VFNTFTISSNASLFLNLFLQSTYEGSHNSEYSRYNSINLHASSVPYFRVAMLEAMSLAQNCTQCPNTWRSNCIRTLLKFKCCCFVFVLSTLRWHRSPFRETWNRTETFWFLPTGDASRESCRKHEHLPRPSCKVAHMYNKCCRIVADLSQDTGFQFCFSFVSLVWTRPNAQWVFRTYLVVPICASSSSKYDRYRSPSLVTDDGPHTVGAWCRTSNWCFLNCSMSLLYA